MTRIRPLIAMTCLGMLGVFSGCGKDEIIETCDEPQPYQSVVPSKRIVVPDGLDPLDEFKEMPIPEAESPQRPAGSTCIENAPSVLTR